MAWDFSTEPEFQEKLDWAREFCRTEVSRLDLVWPHDLYKPVTDQQRAIVDPLKQAVRDEGLWACHLRPELGGQGYGQVRLALLNEILGQYRWAPRIFGTAAPDTGNAEILAHYGTEEQKRRYLQPLLAGDIVSCFSMTEPQGGSDPGEFTTRAVRDGDDWVITGTKYYSSNARWAEFLIVMAVTDPDAPLKRRMSMFLVPRGTPGIDIEFDSALWGEDEGTHALIEYRDVRVPADAMLGAEGDAFGVSQTRLGGGRVHHAMRAVGQAQKALDMMAERALSRHTQGELLARKQAVQMMLADSYAQVQQFRLLVMYTAWQIDAFGDYQRVRKDISTIKFLTGQVLHDVARRAVHLHGALGVSAEMPLMGILHSGEILALTDGPAEVHQFVAARELLRDHQPAEGPWPSAYLPPRREQARRELGLDPVSGR